MCCTRGRRRQKNVVVVASCTADYLASTPHSGPLAGQELLPGTVGFAPGAATRIKTDARNLNSARFVAL